MAHRSMAELRQELSGEPALNKLDPAGQARLLQLVHEARLRQHNEIKTAMDGALEFIPALLRRPVRMLFK